MGPKNAKKRRFENLYGAKRVYQFEATYPYAYINEYPSTVEAARAISKKSTDVFNCCMSRTDLAGGYDWMIETNTLKKMPLEQYGTYHTC